MRAWRTNALRPDDESGYALALALGILVVLSVSLASAIYYASTSVRAANYAESGQRASALAEAGISDALSLLANSSDPSKATAIPACSSPASSTATTGSYTYCGTLTGLTWLLVGSGTVHNPTGPTASPIVRTVTRMATVTPDASIAAWDRIYDNDASAGLSCWKVAGVVLHSNVGSLSPVCLNQAAFAGSTSTVQVNGLLTLSPRPVQQSSQGGDARADAGTGWANPANVYGKDGAYATTTVAGGGGVSGALDATNPGLDPTGIPANAILTGITAKISGLASVAGAIDDSSIQLLLNGNVVGTLPASSTVWGTSLGTITYGSGAETWGAVLKRDDFTSSSLGIRLVVKNSSAAPVLVSIDEIQLTVAWGTDASIGLDGYPVKEADIALNATAQGCNYNLASSPSPPPCSDSDHVFATTRGTTAPVGKPAVSFPYWYANAAPGPSHGCDVHSGTPPTFDGNTSLDVSNPAQEITPEGAPYTCIAKNAAGDRIGELSWDPGTRVLTVAGTIFFDGPITFGDTNTLVRYVGRASLYASGTAVLRETICAGGSGTQVTDCRNASTFGSWDPSVNLLAIIVDFTSTTGVDDCKMDKSTAAFQGALWVQNDCKISGGPWITGPLITQRLTITANPAPQFYAWQPLRSVLPGMSPTGSAPASGYTLAAGQQYGG